MRFLLDTDQNALVDALRDYGVRYLSGGSSAADAGSGQRRPLDPATLLARLARSPEPRLRQALAALFVVHPELAPIAQDVAATLPAPARDQLIHGYIAAVYLRRLWWTRFRRYLGDQPELPPYWLDELGLPAPEELYGRLGLAALAELDRPGGMVGRPAGGRSARLGAYFKVGERLMGQLLAERAATRSAPGGAGV
jgi:hypothetical protein